MQTSNKERQRCPWCLGHDDYIAYHDDEWGVCERDDRALFEKLLLDGFQAGLSWLTILRKRSAFRRAFAEFDPERIARFDKRKIERLLTDASIVRNRAKVEGAVQSARSYLALIDELGSFSDFVWQFTGGDTKTNRYRLLTEVPAETPESKAMSKALKSRGFKFCGPTICYAFMQATGMVNDHLVSCFRYDQV